jgi:hypothetical protein
MDHFKTREQLASDLGLSRTTFWRKLKKQKIKLPHGLISPSKEQEIRNKLLGTSVHDKPSKTPTVAK